MADPTPLSPLRYALARSTALPDEHFATLAAVARRIHALGPEAPIALTPAQLARRGRDVAAVRIERRPAAHGQGRFVGYVLGLPAGELGCDRLATALDFTSPEPPVGAIAAQVEAA